MKEKLWLRKLSCEHERPTNIAFSCGEYRKPRIGEECYCRECHLITKVIAVEEIKEEKQ